MAFQIFSLSLGALYLVGCIVLYRRLSSGGVHGYFPAFRLLIGWEVLSCLCGWLVILSFGLNSFVHGRFYELAGVTSFALCVLALLEARRVLRLRFKNGTWALILGTGLLLALDLRVPQDWWESFRVARAVILHVAVCFSISIGTQLLFRKANVGFFGVGRNLSGILAYLFAASGLQYFLWASLAFGGVGYSYVVWLVQPSVVIVTLATIMQMSTLDLPVQITDRDVQEGSPC